MSALVSLLQLYAAGVAVGVVVRIVVAIGEWLGKDSD